MNYGNLIIFVCAMFTLALCAIGILSAVWLGVLRVVRYWRDPRSWSWNGIIREASVGKEDGANEPL